MYVLFAGAWSSTSNTKPGTETSAKFYTKVEFRAS